MNPPEYINLYLVKHKPQNTVRNSKYHINHVYPVFRRIYLYIFKHIIFVLQKMDEEDALMLLMLRRRIRKRKRLYLVHPINQKTESVWRIPSLNTGIKNG